MYPESVAAKFGGLASYLFSPPAPHEFEDGLLSDAVLKGIDLAILKAVEGEIQQWTPAEVHPTAKNPNSKWRLVSCLQKAIRFGLPGMASFAASCTFDVDVVHLRRRIMVIAVEDVTVGNLFPAAVALAAGGHPGWRKDLDERRYFMWLAEQLASGDKDRFLIDGLVWAHDDKTYPVKEAALRTDEQLTKEALELESPTHRLLAAWLLAGTKRYGYFGMPEDNDRHPAAFMRMLGMAGTTRFGLWLAQRIRSRANEALFVPMLLADEWLRTGWEPGVIERTPPNTEKVGKLLGACYDQYTREGKVALAQWFQIPALAKFKNAAPVKKRPHLVGEGTFLAEGGVLNRQARYGEMDAVFRQVCISENAFAECLPAELAPEFLPTLVAHLPELNEIRKQVLLAQMS